MSIKILPIIAILAIVPFCGQNKKTIKIQRGSYQDCFVVAGNPLPFSVEAEIRRQFGAEYKTALAVAKAESRLKAEAIHKNSNNSVDYGIFQINSVNGYKVSEMLDARQNIKIAREIYEKQGWKAWATYNSNAYQAYYN